jgi:signal transduction histidine kinase
MPDGLHARHQAVLHALADRVVLALQIDESQRWLKTNQMLSSLGIITGTFLHQLKNELLGVSYYFDEIQKVLNDGKLDRAHEYADIVRRSSETFVEKVKRLRDWSTAEFVEKVNRLRDRSKAEAENERVNVGYAARLARERVHVPLNVRVEVHVPDYLPRVEGDEALLVEVYAILIKNAVEAMPDGGLLRVHGQCQTPAGADWVVVRVEDNGKGIDEETEKRLFEPKPSDKPDGLGLGLWLAHSIIELLGGWLQVEHPEVGRGTTFVVGLPVAVAHSRTETVASSYSS